MKRCHIDQIAAGSVPNRMVYRDQIVRPWDVDDVTMMEHPSKLYSADVFLNLTRDILEASRGLPPFFRSVVGEAELLMADRGCERFNVLV